MNNKLVKKTAIAWMFLCSCIFSLSGYAADQISTNFTNPSPSMHQGDRIASWCNQVLARLRQARNEAIQARNLGYMSDAVTRLVNGLTDANNMDQAFKNGPLTSRALSRGVFMANTVATAIQGEHNADMTMLRLLFRYYSFIEHVTSDLDLPLFIPYYSCGYCSERGPANNNLFEQRFLRYAREQVEMVLEALAQEIRQPGLPPVVPAGAPAAFLTAVSLSSASAAMDLRESVQSARFACVIQGLETLSNRISNSGYYNDVQAVNDAFFEARHWVSQLNVQGCGSSGIVYLPGPFPGPDRDQGPNKNDVPQTVSLIGSTLTLRHQGDIEVVRLPYGPRFVHRLIMQVEAVGRDASIMIIANGAEFIIPIPAKDPPALLTIDKEASSIEIIHLSGGKVYIRDLKATMN
ncbi:MAG: hypothetical protein AABZ06_15005 [Bdellovibrionota bacterium]